jgi:hypothetical protein
LAKIKEYQQPQYRKSIVGYENNCDNVTTPLQFLFFIFGKNKRIPAASIPPSNYEITIGNTARKLRSPIPA